MSMSGDKTAHSEVALMLANRGIAHDANGDHDQAVEAWQTASDYADTHLAGEDIHYWIKGGLGAALFEVGAYDRSIAVSGLALDWCAELKQPLPALTIAKCHIRLGNRQSAHELLDQARRLAGDTVFERLEPADRVFLEES